jgi:hypothetical protein
MKSVRAVLVLGSVAVLIGCVPKRETPAPPPVQQPQASPRPRPAPPPPPPAAADWSLVALTPGAWVYSNQGGTSQAQFGAANSEAQFSVRCDRGSRQVSLWREGRASGNMMTVRTSYGARNLPVSLQAEPLPYVHATVPASDRLLDQIAFSRGRFTVEVPGQTMLVIPAWPEPARVVEDCRA